MSDQYVYVVRTRYDDTITQLIGPFPERRAISLSKSYYGNWWKLDEQPWDFVASEAS